MGTEVFISDVFFSKLSGVIIGGFIVWMATSLIIFFLKKGRIERALVTDICLHMNTALGYKDYINEYFETKIIVGNKIEYAAYHSKDELALFKSMHIEIIKFFNQDVLEKVVKFYDTYEIIEVLVDGILNDLWKWKENNKDLNQEDVEYISRKKNRIINHCDEIARKYKIASLSDLPIEYNLLPPSTIIK